MGASKTVDSSVAQQNVSTEAGHFNSYNSIRITLMGNVEDVVAEAHRQYFSATIWVLAESRNIASDSPVSHLQHHHVH